MAATRDTDLRAHLEPGWFLSWHLAFEKTSTGQIHSKNSNQTLTKYNCSLIFIFCELMSLFDGFGVWFCIFLLIFFSVLHSQLARVLK